jgi:hypothetical protein
MRFADAIEFQVIGYPVTARMVTQHRPVARVFKKEVFHLSTSSFSTPPVGELGSAQRRADLK